MPINSSFYALDGSEPSTSNELTDILAEIRAALQAMEQIEQNVDDDRVQAENAEAGAIAARDAALAAAADAEAKRDDTIANAAVVATTRSFLETLAVTLTDTAAQVDTQHQNVTTMHDQVEIWYNALIGLQASSLPDGGTTGQVLTKVSSADGDASWQDLPPASGGESLPFSNTVGEILHIGGDPEDHYPEFTSPNNLRFDTVNVTVYDQDNTDPKLFLKDFGEGGAHATVRHYVTADVTSSVYKITGEGYPTVAIPTPSDQRLYQVTFNNEGISEHRWRIYEQLLGEHSLVLTKDGLTFDGQPIGGGATDWASITGKPTTFTPSTHAHDWASITGKPTTFAPATHAHDWASITDKPTTFAPETHNHDTLYPAKNNPTMTGEFKLTANGVSYCGSDYYTTTNNGWFYVYPSGTTEFGTDYGSTAATPKILFRIRQNAAAEILNNATTLTSANEVVTRQKGDARYGQIGAANVWSAPQTLADQPIRWRSTSAPTAQRHYSRLYFSGILYDYVANDAGTLTADSYQAEINTTGVSRHSWYVGGAEAARIHSTDTTLTLANEVVTRQKGDARYAQLGASSNTFVGAMTIQGADPTIRLTQTGQNQLTVANSLASTFGRLAYTNSAATVVHSECRFTPTDLVLYVNGVVQARAIDGTAESIISRSRGDLRYQAISSSTRYKEDIAYTSPTYDFDKLQTADWRWGGELADDDPKRDQVGFGLIAEDVAKVIPEAITRDAQGRIDGLNSLALIGALVNEIKQLRGRVRELEKHLPIP